MPLGQENPQENSKEDQQLNLKEKLNQV